jgi:hypothetical protein
VYIIQKHLNNLKKALLPGKAVIIYGARRTGKTTWEFRGNSGGIPGTVYLIQKAANQPPLLFLRQVGQMQVRPGFQALRAG